MQPGPADRVRSFYQARQTNDPEALRPWLAPHVCWSEPTVGNHMGLLIGADAVIDMLQRALATTGGTFALQVGATIETGERCAAIIHWQAEKDGRVISGEELAVYGFAGGQIIEACFFASNIANDEAFWG